MCKIFAGVLKSLIEANLSGSSDLLKMNKLTLPASRNKSSENREFNCRPTTGPCPEEMAFSNAVVQIQKIIGILINFHPFYFKNLF
jgi:hypothetical protein